MVYISLLFDYNSQVSQQLFSYQTWVFLLFPYQNGSVLSDDCNIDTLLPDDTNASDNSVIIMVIMMTVNI